MIKNKSQKATLIGGVIGSLIASSCCIGPIIFAFLGVSSAGLLTKMEEYRPIVSLITILLLALAFYFTYRKKPSLECVEGSFCANPKSDIWNKRILWFSSILIIAFLTFPYWSIYLV